MNFYLKYLKYKKKYLELKKSFNQNGGALSLPQRRGENSAKQILAACNSEILDSNLDTLDGFIIRLEEIDREKLIEGITFIAKTIPEKYELLITNFNDMKKILYGQEDPDTILEDDIAILSNVLFYSFIQKMNEFISKYEGKPSTPTLKNMYINMLRNTFVVEVLLFFANFYMRHLYSVEDITRFVVCAIPIQKRAEERLTPKITQLREAISRKEYYFAKADISEISMLGEVISKFKLNKKIINEILFKVYMKLLMKIQHKEQINSQTSKDILTKEFKEDLRKKIELLKGLDEPLDKLNTMLLEYIALVNQMNLLREEEEEEEERIRKEEERILQEQEEEIRREEERRHEERRRQERRREEEIRRQEGKPPDIKQETSEDVARREALKKLEQQKAELKEQRRLLAQQQEDAKVDLELNIHYSLGEFSFIIKADLGGKPGIIIEFDNYHFTAIHYGGIFTRFHFTFEDKPDTDKTKRIYFDSTNVKVGEESLHYNDGSLAGEDDRQFFRDNIGLLNRALIQIRKFYKHPLLRDSIFTR